MFIPMLIDVLVQGLDNVAFQIAHSKELALFLRQALRRGKFATVKAISCTRHTEHLILVPKDVASIPGRLFWDRNAIEGDPYAAKFRGFDCLDCVMNPFAAVTDAGVGKLEWLLIALAP